MISQSSLDLIVSEEVTSKAYYERHYQHPEWPGGASGITIAIGYDLGYASVAKIEKDWGPHVSPAMLAVMKSCAGFTGSAAKALLPKVKNAIVIPWDAAMAVFMERDVPQWVATVQRSVPNTDKIGPTCLGVLTSVAYNRGAAGFNAAGDRYAEMREIRSSMAECKFPPVASYLRAMKRLWPTMKGLRDRRDHEAALWDAGLARSAYGSDAPAASLPGSVAHDPEIPTKAGPARTKPPATTAAQNGTAGAIVVAGTKAATAAASTGFPISTAILIGALSLVAAAGVWWLWYRNRNPK